MLGPEWRPLVEAVEIIVTGIPPNGTWSLNVFVAPFQFEVRPVVSLLALRESDGTIRLELGGIPASFITTEVGQPSLRELMGWKILTKGGRESMAGHQLDSIRVFDGSFSAKEIAEFIFESLVIGFGVTSRDGFSLGGSIGDVRGLDQLKGTGLFKLGSDSNPVDAESSTAEKLSVAANLDRTLDVVGESDGTPPIEKGQVRVTEVVLADYRGQHIEDRDFTGQSLVGANFSNCSFRNVSFERADLSRSDFTGASFEYVSFVHANLTNSRFEDSSGDYGLNFSFANLSGAGLSSVSFDNAWLIESNLSEANLVNARFTKCDFHEATLDGSMCGGARFIRVDFAGASANALNISGSVFVDVYANVSEFSDTDFTTAKLIKCDFSSSVFDRSTFDRLDLSGNDFNGGRFWAASCVGTDFRDAFSGGYIGLAFADARLNGAVFSGETIHNANFLRADLTGAFFEGADLYEVDFSEAVLIGASFRGAQIESCTFDGSGPDTGR
ncbi:MAG: pentapeptide repeat-containing protein [Microbacteriaceae bacterium]|nr:pentapeptide repeat-containing protein [Microbacteriaceae bacterium]